MQMQQAAWRGGYEWVEPKGAQPKGGRWHGNQSQHQQGHGAGKHARQQQQRAGRQQQQRFSVGGIGLGPGSSDERSSQGGG
eukprot:2588139-Alexandrium_andersonii.AAC.1